MTEFRNRPQNAGNRKAAPESWLAHNARWMLLVALAFVCVHDIFGAHGFIAMRRTQQEIAAARDEITQLDTENRALADQVGALKSDPRMIERIAREEMGLARPGEVIFKGPADAAPSGGVPGDSGASGSAAGTQPQQ